MDRERWEWLSARLDEALALAPEARADWLAGWRAQDPERAAALARMLGHADAAQPASPGRPEAAPAAFDALLQQALRAEDHQAAPDEPDLSGRQMGAWRLLAKIGEGGMGQVWLARRADGLYDAQAAIKLLRGLAGRAQLSARFARERAALARLNHPGIARLLDAGVAGEQAYLVLEHVAGRGLAEHVAAACPTVASRVQLLLRIAQAVAHAHAQLIVHRDLKPSNVMVTGQGEPKLLDFGIAGLLDDDGADAGQLTRQAGRGLTLGYAAPEQISGAAVGVAADVYSLGVMLFEMLAGELPFNPAQQATRAAAEFEILHHEAPRLGSLAAGAAGAPGRPADFARVRGDLEAIVAKTLRKAPAERYGSVGAFIDDLQRWLHHRPVSARSDDWRHRSRLWLRRHALASALAAGVVLALLAGLAASTWQWQRADAAARRSEQVATYLTELLASANPDAHGGHWPNVLQLLEKSRAELATKFGNDPDLQIRLLEVLATTYDSLNRYDLAAPLADEWVARAAARYGEDDVRTVSARLMRGQIGVPLGPWGPVVAQLEPVRQRVARLFGPDSEEMSRLLYSLTIGYTKTGRLDDAARTLAEAGRVTDARFPPGHFERAFHHNHVSILYAEQGRLRDSLVELRKTLHEQQHPPPGLLRFALVLRRNTLAMEIKLGENDRVEARAQALIAEMNRLLGPGNAMSATMRPDLARFYTDRGDYARALAEREAALAAAPEGAPQGGLRAALLLSRCLARAAGPAAPGAGSRAALIAEARAALALIDSERLRLGAARADAGLAVARSALLLDDVPLAAESLARVQGDSGLNLAQDAALASRVAQMEGDLRRAQGDLAGSRDRLAQRIAWLARSSDTASPPLWSARLDFAATLVLLRDPAAATALALAGQARPPQIPPGHPLDAIQTYLQDVLQGRDSGPGAAQPRLAGMF